MILLFALFIGAVSALLALWLLLGRWLAMPLTPHDELPEITVASTGFVNRRPYDREHRNGVPYHKWGF